MKPMNLVEKLKAVLGKDILRLKAAKEMRDKEQFDYFLKIYGGFLPSSNARWCTRNMKLEPFEEYVGETPTLSYVGIRGDEDREGYISRKSNIQSIFPFRRNIWSEEIIAKTLTNNNIPILEDLSSSVIPSSIKNDFIKTIKEPLSFSYDRTRKLNDLLTISIAGFNKVVFEFLKEQNYPISYLEDYPLLENEDVLVRDDIFKV